MIRVTESLDPWRAGQPDGGTGEMVGDDGFVLLGYLCDEHPRSDLDSWGQADTTGLLSWLELERELQTLPLPQELDKDRQRLPFERLSAQLHSALPYSEAERHWLTDTEPPNPLLLLTPPIDHKTIVEEQSRHHERYFGLEARIVSAGLIHVVSGRDLMRRWLSWRSETDEYTGQGTLAYAQDALADLIELVAPDESLPASYLALRQRPRT
jgi:hypothetical protein